jgi:hypothetical protein
VPEPFGNFSSIETTDGVTNEAIALTSIEVPLIEVKVRLALQLSLLAKYIAPVLLSTHAFAPTVGEIAALEIPPTSRAPAAKPVPTLAKVELKNFMV